MSHHSRLLHEYGGMPRKGTLDQHYEEMMMNKTMISTLLGLSMLVPVAQASEFDGMTGFEHAEKPFSIEEASGLGVGAIVGGLLAGPAGAFVGGAGGGLIARDGLQQDENKRLQAELESSRTELASLKLKHKQLATTYNKQLLKKVSIVESKAVSPHVTGLGMTVQFRHDSASLETHFVQQLKQVAHSFASVKGLHIHLSGHADRTGPDSYNDRLSQSRVESVAGVLSKAGWPATRIHMNSHGETKPLTHTDDHKGYGFDRRVMITFSAGGKGA
jgi:sortase system peptidoglycan-associated protein